MPALETMESILVALWRASWQASLLILLVLLAQVTLRRWLSPAWRSALWLLVVARLLLPVTPSSAWSLFNLTSHFDALRAMALHPPAAVEANAHRSAGLRHGDVEPSYPFQHAELREAGTPTTIPPGAPFQTAFNDPALGEASLPPVPAATIQASRGSWLPILFWIWLSGVLVLGARIVGGACLLSRRIRRHAVVADRRTSELLEESRRVIGTYRAPVLVETDAVDSPALFGLLRPKLLLPTGLIQRLDESELRHVFLHELAHLRRHDLLLNWLAALLQILHWFNPVVWFGFARMRADRELACDALALTRSDGIDRAAYGTTILKLVSDLTPVRPVAGLVGISEGKAHLKHRLRNIASYRKPTRRSTVTGTLVLLCLTGVTLTDARTNRDISELSAEAIEAVPAQFEAQERGVSVPLAEPSVAMEAVKAGPGRQRIEAKLQRTVLDEVQFDGLTLPDVLSYLGEVVRQQDPDREGINFLISPQLMAVSRVPVVDPTSGQLIPPPEVEPTDMNIVRIRIDPALRNVRLGALLEAITRGADRPIAYSIEEYAIVFAPRPPELGVQLETRIFKVDPVRLLAGIHSARPAGSQDSDLNPQTQVRNYFRDTGVSVLPPNQIYFNDRKHVLMVRATPEELDLIQATIVALQKDQPQDTPPPSRTDDGSSARSGEHMVMEDRIFRISLEKLMESHRRLGPADNLTENTPGSDHIAGSRANGEELTLDLLSLPRLFELEDEAAAGLPGVTATNLTEMERQAHLALRRFLRSVGVGVMPPNQIQFSVRRGLLMVFATSQELDNLTKALEALGGAQRKIELEVRAVELTRTESREMGFDWFIGSTEAKPQSAGVFPGGPGATAPEPAHTPASAADSGAPVPPYQLTGILTEQQFSVVLGALERRPDTEIISLPSVTTSSGQPTRISWITAAGSTVEVDCLPVAGSDGYSLDLTLTVDYGDDSSEEMDPAGMTATRASARQTSTRRAVVWTGQTAVMGGLISESVSESADETLRRLRNLIVFITPTIFDATGNRMRLPHPFDPDTIPLQ